MRSPWRKAKRLADLALHRSDLAFAMNCLEGINQVPEEPWVLREGLWRSAIVHLMKCYGSNNARFNLDVHRVLKGEPAGKEAFSFFRELRNMHLVHDSNAYSQCLPGAVLNKEGMEHKIAKITCHSFRVQTLDQVGFTNVRLLITHSMEWVVRQIDEIGNDLTKELEALPYADLLKRDSPIYAPPKPEEIAKRRSSS